MKRAFLVYPIAYSVLAVALFVNIAGAGYVLAAVGNMMNGEQGTIAEPQLVCWVSDTPGGAAVANVKDSSPWAAGDEWMYWANYRHGGVAATSLVFLILHEGVGWGQSEQLMQLQVYSYTPAYSGATTTPFGVTRWAGDPQRGPAYLIPIVDGTVRWDQAYRFTVVD